VSTKAGSVVTPTEHVYVERVTDIAAGEPVVRGTRTTVRTVVVNWKSGIPPENIPEHLPHLSVAQVFDALSYYADHQAEIDHYIHEHRYQEELVDARLRDL
jgi:uncharacterized protein (DUF433 family)